MNYPFEMHLTVKNNQDSDFIDVFKIACDAIGVKPLIVELGDVGLDVMTSSRFEGNFLDALAHANTLANSLGVLGLDVIRTKIETAPWHPEAATPNNSQYFESHLAVEVEGDEKERELRTLSVESGCHTSRNAFKVYPNYKVIMVTKRDVNCSAPEFISSVDEVRKVLTDSDFKVGKPIVEFVIYDSNQAHDNEWVAELNLSHEE